MSHKRGTIYPTCALHATHRATSALQTGTCTGAQHTATRATLCYKQGTIYPACALHATHRATADLQVENFSFYLGLT